MIFSLYVFKIKNNGAYCIRIWTREGIYGKIWPEPEGNPKGSGQILPYIPNCGIIQIQYIETTVIL